MRCEEEVGRAADTVVGAEAIPILSADFIPGRRGDGGHIVQVFIRQQCPLSTRLISPTDGDNYQTKLLKGRC